MTTNMKKIELEIPEGKKAEWVNGVLTLVDEKPKDITERIKTFEDACIWCRENGKGDIAELWYIHNFDDDDDTKDIDVYLQLRIITCALNEGWKPSKGDRKYTAYYTKVYRYIATMEIDGFACNTSSKLCFKSPELAIYAAKQFRDIYAEFCGCEKGDEG